MLFTHDWPDGVVRCSSSRWSSAHGTAGDVYTLADLGEVACAASYLRVHRNWLVSIASVSAMEREDSDWVLTVGNLRVHVARDRASTIREKLLASAIGLRTTS